MRLRPELTLAHNDLGNAFFHQRQWAKAVASYQQATRIKPDFAEAHTNLGMALQHQGQLAEAVARFKQAVGLRPDFAEAHHVLGTVLRAPQTYNEPSQIDAQKRLTGKWR